MIFKVFDVDLGLNQQDLRVCVPIMGCLIGFLIFWFTQGSDKLKQKFLLKHGHDQGYAKFIINTRYLGAFTMGVLPAVAFLIAFPDTSLSQLGLGLYIETLPATLIWSIGLCGGLIPLVSYGIRKSKKQEHYPQIRAREWTIRMVTGNLAAWFVYLLGYEFLFRGVLLFPLVGEIGLWPAIAINVSLYTGSHIPYGLKITLGTIPLSIVLCLLSLHTGTIWVAFFVHLTMAWTNSLTSLKRNPEMKIVKS